MQIFWFFLLCILQLIFFYWSKIILELGLKLVMGKPLTDTREEE